MLVIAVSRRYIALLDKISTWSSHWAEYMEFLALQDALNGLIASGECLGALSVVPLTEIYV